MEEGARGRVECSRGGVGFVMMGCGVLQAGIKEGEGIRCVVNGGQSWEGQMVDRRVC